MRFFLYGSRVPTDQLVPLAVAAEAAGYDAITIPDHVLHPIRVASAYPYATSPAVDRPPWDQTEEWPDSLIAAMAIAGATTRLEVLTAIFLLPLRHPVHVAKALATLDVLTNSRVMLGVGTGWLREEFDILGEDFATRGARSTEAIEVMRKLWTGEPVRHDGAAYTLPDVVMRPPPRRAPRVYVGSAAEPALRRAASHGDGLIPPVKSSPQIAEVITRVTALRQREGRDGPFEIVAPAVTASTPDDIGALEAIGAAGVHVNPFALYCGRHHDLTLTSRVEALQRFAAEVIVPFRG